MRPCEFAHGVVGLRQKVAPARQVFKVLFGEGRRVGREPEFGEEVLEAFDSEALGGDGPAFKAVEILLVDAAIGLHRPWGRDHFLPASIYYA